MPACEQADAVGTYQRTAVLLAGVEDALLQLGTLGCLLAEACRNNNERTNILLLCQQLHIVGTEAGRHHEDGQVGGRQLTGIVEGLDALHLVFLGIHHTQHAAIAAAHQVAYHGAAWFMHIVGAAYHDDALRFQ